MSPRTSQKKDNQRHATSEVEQRSSQLFLLSVDERNSDARVPVATLTDAYSV